MTEAYDIVLDSPMGPRRGRLTLNFSPEGEITGTLSLLGLDNPVRGRRAGDGEIHLVHRLRSRMTELECRSTLRLTGEALTGRAETNRGRMFWRGTRVTPKP